MSWQFALEDSWPFTCFFSCLYIPIIVLIGILVVSIKVSFLRVVALWGDYWLHIYSDILGVIVADLNYVALFEDVTINVIKKCKSICLFFLKIDNEKKSTVRAPL